MKWMICCVVLFQFSCSSGREDIMSKREMRLFLTDLHLLEGVFSADYTIDDDEKLYYYHALFLKHGITKAQFDSSLVYYTRNPKMFERIYTRVNENLAALKTDVDAGKYLPVIPDSIKFKPAEVNIWELQTSLKYPDDSAKHKLVFNLTKSELLTKDVYNFSFRMRAFPHDSIKTGHTAFRIHYADGNVDSLWHEVKNDSVLRRYKFRFKAARNIKIDSLSGVFYTSIYHPDSVRVYVDSIMLLRKYVPFLQDSLRIKLDTIPSLNQTIDSIKREDSIPRIKSASAIKKEVQKNRKD